MRLSEKKIAPASEATGGGGAARDEAQCIYIPWHLCSLNSAVCVKAVQPNQRPWNSEHLLCPRQDVSMPRALKQAF